MNKTTTIALFLLTAAVACAQTTILPFLPPSVSTVPGNGDVNPYGIAFVPKNIAAGGGLQAGDILVTNFNNSNNLQGTGTTIMRVNVSTGQISTFYAGPASRGGFSAAIGILSNGIVLAGNLLTADGTAATAQPGVISVFDRYGNFLGTFGSVDGPWGMTVYDTGNGISGTAHAFISNVLSGTVVRYNISYSPTNISTGATVVATGFNHRGDPAALELGPAGLAYSASNDTLYVASSFDNAVYLIPTAMAAQAPVSAAIVFQDFTHLHGPLGLAILPNGHFLVANSDGSNADPNQPSELVEYTAGGQFIAQSSIDPNNGGAFGLAVNNMGWGTVRVAYVDDNTNTLKISTTVVH
jgi:hypothetical protein